MCTKNFGIFLISLFVLAGCISTSKPKLEKALLHIDVGEGHMKAGRYPQALQSFLDAEKLSPNDHRVHHALGLAYMAREKYDLAEKHLQKSLDIAPQNTMVRNDLVQLYLQTKKYKNAEELLKISAKDLTYPQPETTYYLQGYLKFEQQNYPTALTYFERALKFNKENCFIHSYYGRTLFELKRYEEATRSLDQAVGLCKENGFDEPHYYSALAYYRLGETEQSRARFNEVTRFYPEGKYKDRSRAMLDLISKVGPQ